MKIKLLTCASLLLSTLSLQNLASAADYTPSLLHNGAGLMVYSLDGFGHSTDDRSEVDNLVKYLSSTALVTANIVYLDGFNVSGGGSSSSIPTLQDFPNYSYAVSELHKIGKTVILASAISATSTNVNSNNIVSDLQNIVDTIGADGLSFDDEISQSSQTYFNDNQTALNTLAKHFTGESKYFGIITNLGGAQEGAIAPLFNDVTCKASAHATNYCFESIMRYDQGTSGDDASSALIHEIPYIASINKVNFYQGNNSATHQPLIRFMLPASYSSTTYPSMDSSGVSTHDAGYSYARFICDMTQITHYWKFASFLDAGTSNCPSSGTLYVNTSDPSSINSGGRLFDVDSNFVFAGVDFYRIVTSAYATARPEGGSLLTKDHYLCNPEATSGDAYACSANYNDSNLQKWVPNLTDAYPLIEDNAESAKLKITTHFVSDTLQKFVVTGGVAGDTCTLSITGDQTSTNHFSLDSSGNANVPVTLPDVSASPTENGETDDYSLVCAHSAQVTGKSFTRYGDKAKLCIAGQTSYCVTFGEAKEGPVTSTELPAGSYSISVTPSKLNNTQECDTSGYCDNTLTPYTLPADSLDIDGDQNLSMGFYRDTTQKNKGAK